MAQLSESPMHAASPKRFVILSVPRVGSNYLCALLNSLPEVLCHHELFNDQGIHLALDLRDSGDLLGTMQERDRDPLAFLDRVWAMTCERLWLGFKLAWRAPQVAFEQILEDPTIAKLVLDRENRVKMFVSEQVARAEWQWTFYDTRPEDLPPRRVPLDTEAFLTYNRTMDAFYSGVRTALRQSGQSWLELRYETLFERETHRRILEFLEIPASPSSMKSATFKRNSQDLRDVLSNFERARGELAGTPWEAQLASTEL